jgi:DNA-binding CsgD family transcriptional regulator
MKNSIARQEVEHALQHLTQAGKSPTPGNIRQSIGRGSYSTIIRLRDEILGSGGAPESVEGQAQFRKIWASANAEGRKQADGIVAERDQTILLLETESDSFNTKLDAAHERIRELEISRDKVIGEAAAKGQEAAAARVAGEELRKKLTEALERETQIVRAHMAEVTALREQLSGVRPPVELAGERFAAKKHRRCVTLSVDEAKVAQQFGFDAIEARVLSLASRNATNPEIAAAIRYSHAAIERFLAGAYRKLGVKNRCDAISAFIAEVKR